MDDLISRQAVIDAFHTWFRGGFEEDDWWNRTHVLAAIEGLPSAQPAPCEFCKHNNIADDKVCLMCSAERRSDERSD